MVRTVRVIGSLIVILSALFSVHAAAQQRNMYRDLKKIERESEQIREENRVYEAEIAELSSPDRIVRIAEYVLSMKRAGEEDLVLVKRE